MTRDQAVLAIVGAGPKGVSVLERVCANVPELFGGRRLLVHLVDPFPPGGGRVWRDDQSSLLLMNSKAQDVSLFVDESVVCDGPARPGPSLAEWTAAVRTGDITADVPPELAGELASATTTTYHTRRMQSAYLRWCYQRVLESAPAGVEVRVHRTTALDLDEECGEQLLVLEGEQKPLRVDVVVLAVGHLDAEPGPTGAALLDFARRHGGAYYPPSYTADTDLSGLRPGEHVLVRGFGLAFMDLMALLSEGRGGHYVEVDGELIYRASGNEPVLHVGSRRGVPYRPKPGYPPQGEPAALPRFFTPQDIDRLAARPGQISFGSDLWPLMAKEIGWAYYSELFTGHPDRVRVPFEEFAGHYAGLDWATGELAALVEKAVPDPDDRLDLHRWDRPLTGLWARGPGEVSAIVRGHVRSVLRRSADPRCSADLGAVQGLLSVFRQMPLVVATGKLDPVSQLRDIDGWWFGFFSYVASGPPAPRLRELLALERAGVLRFVGPDMTVLADEKTGLFTAHSPAVPGTVRAATLVEARLPEPDVARTTNPVVRALHARGRLGIEQLTGDTGPTVWIGRIHTTGIGGRLINDTGVPEARVFALGPHTTLRVAGAFSRPHSNALGFREADLVAREVLAALRDPCPSSAPQPCSTGKGEP